MGESERTRRLAKAMASIANTSQSNVDAGYTYIGQFIAHDIVPATVHSSATAGARPVRPNVRPYLDLNSLYGSLPYSANLFDSKQFIISDETDDRPVDLNRDPHGRALIPEPRNDENTIISQYHLLWLRFHNLLIEKKLASSVSEARCLVTKVFQLVVIDDYLRVLLEPRVYESYFEKGRRWLKLDFEKLPAEFSHAAFRFGHSMVRQDYEGFADPTQSSKLEDLFREQQCLSNRFEIRWDRFYDWPRRSGGVQNAMKIDPFVEPVMTDLPGGINVIELNLAAGRMLGLPSGSDYVRHRVPRRARCRFGLQVLEDRDQLEGMLNHPDDFGIDDLPLWPYILVEAHAFNRGTNKPRGGHLGVLGSLICADVMSRSIAGAENSVYEDGRYRLSNALASMGELGERLSHFIEQHADKNGNSGTRLSMRHVFTFFNQG